MQVHGIEHRTVLYVGGKPLQPRAASASWKREPPDPAPIWSDREPSTAQRGAGCVVCLRASRAGTFNRRPPGPDGMTRAQRVGLQCPRHCRRFTVRAASFWRTSAASTSDHGRRPLWTKPKANSKNARPPASAGRSGWDASGWPASDVGGMAEPGGSPLARGQHRMGPAAALDMSRSTRRQIGRTPGGSAWMRIGQRVGRDRGQAGG